MKKIAIYNSKGGVGKTTLSITLSHILAINGFRVLLIDADGQRNATKNFGIKPSDLDKTLLHLCLDNTIEKERYIHRVRSEKKGYVDLISNSDFQKINKLASLESNVDGYLSNILKPLENDYDMIIFDCSPTESYIIDAVLCYVNNLLIPLTPEYYSVDGINMIYERLNYLKINSDIIKAVIPNMMNNTNDAKENIEFIYKYFGDKVTESIPKRVAFAEATKYNETIWEHKKDDVLINLLKSIIIKVVNSLE